MEASREKKIETIQRVIGNKELSFGCKVTMQDNDYDYHSCRIVGKHRWLDYVFTTDIGIVWEADTIEGHPVMIWDVLDWIDKNCWWLCRNIDVEDFAWSYWANDELGRILNNWYRLRTDLRKPIEDQSDGCISYVYSLIPEDER